MSCNVSQIIKNHAIYIQSHFSCKDVFEGLILCEINLTRDYDLTMICVSTVINHQKSPSHTSVFFAPLF